MTIVLQTSPTPRAATRPSRLCWEAILSYGPLCWVVLGLVEVLNMEAWRVANTAFQVAPPTVRATQFLLLLPVLLLTCRAAVWVGSAAVSVGLRGFAQLALCLAFSALARPALVTAAWLTQQQATARSLAASLLTPTTESLAVWIASMAAMALNYALCLGVIVGVKTYRELVSERVARAEVEREAIQARLQALTNQLNPHFLFNVLNTIVSLIESRPRLAQTMVTRFADLLRRILSDGATQFVSLSRELELIEQYVEIQEMRFPQRLTHEKRIAADAAEALVPALVMQPIIENAVMHGLRNDGRRVHILIEARIAERTLEIRVSNPGPITAVGTPAPGLGVGLRNVAERLATLFGVRAGVALDMPEPGCYVATVHVPLVETPMTERWRAA